MPIATTSHSGSGPRERNRTIRNGSATNANNTFSATFQSIAPSWKMLWISTTSPWKISSTRGSTSSNGARSTAGKMEKTITPASAPAPKSRASRRPHRDGSGGGRARRIAPVSATAAISTRCIADKRSISHDPKAPDPRSMISALAVVPNSHATNVRCSTRKSRRPNTQNDHNDPTVSSSAVNVSKLIHSPSPQQSASHRSHRDLVAASCSYA